MRVGVDLRVLQIGHQYRGIGEHVRQLVHHFPGSPGFHDHRFVFLTYANLEDPTSGLAADLDRYPGCRVEQVGTRVVHDTTTFAGLAGRFRDDLRPADERMLRGVDVDALLCFDFNLGLPRRSRFRTSLIVYDLIPLLFPREYLPRVRDGLVNRDRMRTVLAGVYSAWRYHRRLRRAVSGADLLLPISDNTRRDLEAHLQVAPDRLRTVHLGTSAEVRSSLLGFELNGVDAGTREVCVDVRRGEYLLYIGGADPRRRIIDLVRAFELLRARGSEGLRLYLAGFDFRSVESVPHAELRGALLASSCRDEIVMLGFVSEDQRRALFRRATAFVYPSLYEGFGLPILEAMSNRCPVVTYANSAVVETGGAAALYARGPDDIATHVLTLMEDEEFRAAVVQRGVLQAGKFPWSETASRTLEAMSGLLSTSREVA